MSCKDWERRLLMNVPRDPNTGELCLSVVETHPLTIDVGWASYGDDSENPVQQLRSLAGRHRKDHDKEDLHVKGIFLPRPFWTDLESGFLRLGEFLAFLGEEEIPFERWGHLDIVLDDVEHPYDMSSPALLPLHAFSNLRKLTWTGHRKHLLVSWLPFTPTLLRTLTSLEIQCDISLQDCCHMLFYGENLKEFTVKIIQRDLATEPILGCFLPESTCTERPLEYLCLVSDDDIGALLRPFHFPHLSRIDFTIAHRTPSYYEWKIWKTLQSIELKGEFSFEEQSWIVSQCAVKPLFRHATSYAMCASSFKHNHNTRNPPFFEVDD
ncbi:hypothetical protein H0H93_001564 [Arthromyces matolae]|nr:hypothetical protein H0H93_001564 [Arthromyces matolae]